MPEHARWALMLHGGAKSIAESRAEANRAGCLAAAQAGRAVLAAGGSAVEAVEATIRVLEDTPVFNAGYGSVRNADGEVEMDAALMDGETLDLGGVAAIQGVRHPISVARLMLARKPTLLAGEGARRFAAAQGADLCDPAAMISPEQLASEAHGTGYDTVGCVALDLNGRLAAGTSTGGLTGKPPGRVGDSPLPGCGLYAEAGVGAVSLSGEGEAISRTLVAARVMRALETGPPQAAAEAGVARLERVGGEMGAIVVDPRGRMGWAHNSEHFAVAMAASWLPEVRVFLNRGECNERTDDAD